MVATLSAARLRHAFLLPASWNDPLTLKLITRSTDPSSPLIVILSNTCSQFYPHGLSWGCTYSNYGCTTILCMIHSAAKRDTGGERGYFRGEAPEFEQRSISAGQHFSRSALQLVSTSASQRTEKRSVPHRRSLELRGAPYLVGSLFAGRPFTERTRS